MTHKDYMLCAIDQAFTGMRGNKGGPFGAVIVLDGIIVGKGYNMVTSTNDPTAHAEIIAIRNACERVAAFHLPNALLYTSCEPCPMCLAAIYWANIKTIYYCADRIDAAHIGFNDKLIYDELVLSPSKGSMNIEQLHLPLTTELFNEWANKPDKTSY